MLTLPHMITGAALASLLPQEPIVIPVAFAAGWASHHVLDRIPHWERLYQPFSHQDFETDTPIADWPKHIFIQAVADVLLAFLVIGLVLVERNELNSFWLMPTAWGALGAFLPDLLDNLPLWNQKVGQLPLLGAHQRFHQRNHVSDLAQQQAPRYFGLISQLVMIGVGLWVLL